MGRCMLALPLEGGSYHHAASLESLRIQNTSTDVPENREISFLFMICCIYWDCYIPFETYVGLLYLRQNTETGI